MSELTSPSQGFLFISVIFHQDYFSKDELVNIWTQMYGEGSFFTSSYNPSLPYYAKEMGNIDKLSRFIFCSEIGHPRERLIEAKIWATNFEDEHKKDGKRTVNIDIGLLNPENMILATGKNYSHRVYLAQGVFADLNYQYQNGAFQMFPWTYPDYQEDKKLLFFKEMRSKLLKWQKQL